MQAARFGLLLTAVIATPSFVDIYTIDEQLVMTGTTYLRTLFSVISTIVVIAGITPVFLIFLLPMIAFYMHEQAFFTVSLNMW